MPIVFFDRALSSTGFNMFPTYSQAVEIAGRLFVNNEDIVSKFTGIGGAAKSATTNDWNTACGILSGLYMGSNMSNAPAASSNWFFVFHMVHNNLYQRQIAYDFFGINVWTRRMDNGTWGSWVKVDLSSTYSTNEMAVGEWIDGSPVYKKTIDCGAESSLGGTTSTPINIPNFEKAVKIEGIMLDQYGESYPLPYSDATMTNTNANYEIQVVQIQGSGSWEIWITRGSVSLSISKIYVTLYYTKSSN